MYIHTYVGQGRCDDVADISAKLLGAHIEITLLKNIECMFFKTFHKMKKFHTYYIIKSL